MGICRTRFKKDIVTEFMPARNRKSGKVMIYCGGVPGVPHKDETLEFWAARDYWTFFPRYRGTWESAGIFLKESPENDLLDVIDGLSAPFKDYWSDRMFKFRPESITVVGTSFGGPAALLASRDVRVQKAVCVSPVVDWIAEDKNDPLDHLYKILRDGYGAAYRTRKSDWNKLAKGNFYNPVRHLKELDKSKILVMHAEDDQVVHFKSVNRFVSKLGCRKIFLKRGGHLSSSMLMMPRYCRMLEKFIAS